MSLCIYYKSRAGEEVDKEESKGEDGAAEVKAKESTPLSLPPWKL